MSLLRVFPPVLALVTLTAAPASAAGPGVTEIASIAELRGALTASGQKIRMKPGTYLVQDALADKQTVFQASGSDNEFDLRGVTIQVDTQVLATLKTKRAHELTTYRVTGSNNTFEGAIFEDVGDAPPARSLSDFHVAGNGNVFRDCTFIIRGSAPYGYGSLFGKGTERTYQGVLRKHAGMSVRGDNIQVLGCRFFVETFGHAISMHGAQDTLIRDTTVEGRLRSTDDILAETSGPAFEMKFRDMDGHPIPPGCMLALTEDGIRAYFDENHDGKRRTGAITVINCMVKRMRGGITLSLASKPAHVEGCTVTESGWTGNAYDVPSGSVVKNCKGDAAYSPLLNQYRSNKSDTSIALEVLPAAEYRGPHPLAIINGTGHTITLAGSGLAAPRDCQIILGAPSGRGESGDDDEKESAVTAKNIQLANTTPQPVLLTDKTSNCTIASKGPVTNQGAGNQIRRP